MKEAFRLASIEIADESANPDKVWIYMISVNGERLEGGEFDKYDLMDVILDFYNKNY